MRGCILASVAAVAALAFGGGLPACPSADTGKSGPDKEANALPTAPTTPQPKKLPKTPVAEIQLSPASPREGQPIIASGGPIGFHNGCEGIASVEVKREGTRLQAIWIAKTVPPDAICSMNAPIVPIIAELGPLPAGDYHLAFVPRGGALDFSVLPTDLPPTRRPPQPPDTEPGAQP